MGACSKTGKFTITDCTTDDPSISKKEMNKGQSEVLGKYIYIEKVGNYFKIKINSSLKNYS